MIKTVTTTTGVNTVTFPEFFKYFWIKNIGDTTVYASAFANVSAGVDNTSVIKSGDTVCVENIDNDNAYISGEGSVEIHAQNYADCPFKLGGKGGEIPDLSVYAKKTDIPTELPANGGNADTVDGLHADVFLKNTVMQGLATSINDMVSADVYGVSSATPDFPSGYGTWGFLEIRRYGNICYQTIRFDSGVIINRVKNITSVNWSEWQEIYTSGNKPYVTGTLSEQANDSPVTLSFTIFDFTPSKVICQFGNGNAFFANVVTNGFSLTIPAGTTTIHYIAFK